MGMMLAALLTRATEVITSMIRGEIDRRLAAIEEQHRHLVATAVAAGARAAGIHDGGPQWT